MNTAFSLSHDDRGVATLCFDVKDSKVNKFSAHVMDELEKILDDIKSNNHIKLLVLKSAKKNIFIAGADIEELRNMHSENDAEEKSKRGQSIFNKIENLPFPSLAIIDGACLGGGFECAMACTYRLASDNSKTTIGLPEVNLGILPGWGGTQRLPRIAGLQSALTLILTGKAVSSKKAYKMGLVNKLSAVEFIEVNSEKYIVELLAKKSHKKTVFKKRGLVNFLLEKNPLGRKIIFNKSRENILKKTKGMYPAPLKALEVIEESVGLGLKEGLDVEARLFKELACTQTCKNLIQVYFSNELLKKDPGFIYEGDSQSVINQAAVLGAGVMGGGIGWLFSNKDIPVRIKDLNWDAIAKGFQAASDIYKQLKKIRKIKDKGIKTKMSSISASTDFNGFSKNNIVVEAIVENIDIKKSALSELEEHLDDTTLICSNTSALSIDEMASSLKKPERFLGMHFFNPVNRMPLVEIIPGEKTDPSATQSIIDLTRKLGKTPLVVKNCPGFLVNRILLPYMNESVRILEEMGDLKRIDDIILKFGMPMGPFTLADEVGIDVGFHVSDILEKGFGERMKTADLLTHLHHEKKLLGKKANKGFFIYNGKEKTLNEEIQQSVKTVRSSTGKTEVNIDDQTITQRCIYIMINEAALCLQESIVSSPAHLDMGLIMGTGFPPFRGGLLKYADQIGINNIVQTLKSFESKYGERFKVAERLVEMADANRCFYDET
jgi:3-hydroxyacyl-CoA dehydrogenase / enoyl-CoA hydratase / 3-hydroxybutyryl-CoA epimerase